MDREGMLGAKTGAGFYQKRDDDILTLDLATLEYRAKQSAKLPSIEAGKTIETSRERIRTLYHGKDKAGAFLRATLGPTLELRPADRGRRSPTRTTTSTRRCSGASAGSLGRSRRSLRSLHSQSPTSQLPT
jgi:hypothetical protein